MAQAKEFIYKQTKELGTIGTNTVEIGRYVVDGKEMNDKVYMVNHFTKKDGTEGSKANAICSLAEANQLGEILKGLK